MIYRLTRQQVVAASLDDVWAFFATPTNLNEMTPANMQFETIRGNEGAMYQGQLIEYRVQFMLLVKSRWLTEIAHIEEKSYFVDEQRIGPYNFWHHEYRFEAVHGGTLISDQVTYELPLGPLGKLIHAIWVGPQLKSIFDFRQEKVEEIFSSQHMSS